MSTPDPNSSTGVGIGRLTPRFYVPFFHGISFYSKPIPSPKPYHIDKIKPASTRYQKGLFKPQLSLSLISRLLGEREQIRP